MTHKASEGWREREAPLLAARQHGAIKTAQLELGSKLEPREIEVLVPGHRRPQAGFRLRTCRNLDPRDITIVDRIPVTTVARTLVDLSDSKDAQDLAFMMHEAAYLGKLSLEATWAELAAQRLAVSVAR